MSFIIHKNAIISKGVYVMPDMQKIYDAKLKRVEDARKVLEPDQIPIVPVFQAFPVYFANKWTIADIMAD